MSNSRQVKVRAREGGVGLAFSLTFGGRPERKSTRALGSRSILEPGHDKGWFKFEFEKLKSTKSELLQSREEQVQLVWQEGNSGHR